MTVNLRGPDYNAAVSFRESEPSKGKIESHKEERSVADREPQTLARRIQQLAESGDYEGFNAILGSLDDEVDTRGIEIVKRDLKFKRRITDICQEAWDRKHAPRH